MTLMNKSVMQILNFPLSVLLVQNLGGCFIGLPYFWLKANVQKKREEARRLKKDFNLTEIRNQK